MTDPKELSVYKEFHCEGCQHWLPIKLKSAARKRYSICIRCKDKADKAKARIVGC